MTSELRTVYSAASTVRLRPRTWSALLARRPRRSCVKITSQRGVDFTSYSTWHCATRNIPPESETGSRCKSSRGPTIYLYLILIVSCTCPRSQLTRTRVHERSSKSIILFSGPSQLSPRHGRAPEGEATKEARQRREGAMQGGSRVVVVSSWGLRQAGTTGRYDRGAAPGTGSRAPTGLPPLTPG